jgi:Protein of Unknown function (DUF2784)
MTTGAAQWLTARRPARRQMGDQTLADVVVLVHLAFVAFVVFGGLAVLRWPRLAWAHIPAAIWGVVIEYTGWVCPLTPLENALRGPGAVSAYTGGFVEHYVVPVLYPADLTRAIQMALGTVALLLNLLVYWQVLRRRRAKA